jgi:hypothetical protein
MMGQMSGRGVLL